MLTYKSDVSFILKTHNENRWIHQKFETLLKTCGIVLRKNKKR